MVAHELPSRAELDTMVFGLPLSVVEVREEPNLYIAVLQVRARCNA
jgi:hypothetical protein